MSSMCAYDKNASGVSDCQSSCGAECVSKAGDGHCDAGRVYTECMKAECGWDMGDCGICDIDCMDYLGPVELLGDGECHSSCNTKLCDFDGGDCFDESRPYEVYVSSSIGTTAYGSWDSPYRSFHQSMQNLWAPFTVIHMLKGTHLLGISAAAVDILVFEVRQGYVKIDTLFCTGKAADHPECATTETTIQFTRSSVTIGVNKKVLVENVVFRGGFSLVQGCTKTACTYCPAVHLNLTTGLMNDDRNKAINPGEYADQSLCDFYQNSALIRMRPESSLTMTNVTFVDIKHQLKALILNECGDLIMNHVTISDVMTRRLGLQGGIITQIPNPAYDPYYCGSFVFNNSLVELVNNGYEYSAMSYFSGFLWLDALRLINITNVVFRYNYCMVGKLQQVNGSALLHLQRFRQFILKNCFFNFNLVDTGAAFYINSALSIPLTIVDGLAVEHTLQHITVENNLFVNNTGRRGAVIYIRFLNDHQNVLLRNNTFINNFATDVGVVDISNAYLLETFGSGETMQVLYQGIVVNVVIPPVSMVWENIRFYGNYAPYITFVTNVANFLISDIIYRDNGKSLSGIDFTSYVVKGYTSLSKTYMKEMSPDIAQGDCAGTFYIENPYTIKAHDIVYDGSICPKGFPGMTVRGDTSSVRTKQIDMVNLEFKNSIGSGMLALTVSIDLTLTTMIFRNNTNTNDELSVCINIRQTLPTHCVIRDSTFIGNKAVYSTIASVIGAKSLTFENIYAENNIAQSTSAGLMFTPLVNEDSFITVKDTMFLNSSSLRSGMIFINEETGNMLNGGARITITVENTTFAHNRADNNGCSLTISGFILLSSNSRISNSKFQDNICSGAGLFANFLMGAILIENSIFLRNIGEEGTAIYSTHQGTADQLTHLDIRNCILSNNTGNSIVLISGKNTPLLLTHNNTFQYNNGSCVSITAGEWVDSGSVYDGNLAFEGAVFTASSSTQVSLSNFTALRNEASIKGGVASISIQSAVACLNCTFTSNTCDEIGGVISIDLKSVFNCTNCLFSNNTAAKKGSVIYSLFSAVVFKTSQIWSNHALDYGTLSIMESSFSISDSKMWENTAVNQSPGIIASVSNITMQRCNMTNQFGETGAFFFTAITNLIIIEDSYFSHGSATFGGAFYSMIFSTFIIRRSIITNCSATSEGSVAQVRDSAFILENVTITKAVTSLSNGAFYLVQSSINVSACRFSHTQGNAIIGTTSLISAYNSTFEHMVAIYGSAINCIDCTSLVITSNTFTDNLSQKGGAIYSFTTGLILERLSSVYHGNVFSNNRAVNGGAIFSESMNFDLKDNVFVNNSADSAYYLFDGLLKQRGEGGAIYSVCAYIMFCSETISGNTFINNSAEIKGGAIYWADSFPIMSNNEMLNNSAVYGNDVASFPVKLVWISNDTFSDYLSKEEVPLAASLYKVGSGQVLEQTLKFGLVDHYGHIVSIDNLSGAQLFADDSVIKIGGTTQVLAIAGVFTFTQLVFSGIPTSTQNFKITTTGVDINLKILSGDVTSYYPTVVVQVIFRECVMGETIQGIDCYVCPSGTYSLDPKEPCNSCPSHLTCYGNFTMGPDPGYWRPDITTDVVLSCPLEEACVGSRANDSYASLIGLCGSEYEGNLCTHCRTGYSRQGKYKCGKCPGLASNVLISVLIIGVALSFGAFIVILAIRGATRPRSELAIYAKIFMNYLQMIVVAASLNLNWPSFVSSFLSSQETAGSVTEQMFSFDCLMQEMSMSNLYYTKIVAYSVMPAALMIFAILMWLIVRVCCRVSELLQKSIATLVFIIFVLHPSLSKMMFSMFSCQEIKPGEYWLVSDLSLLCWSPSHIRYMLIVSIPSITLWIFGLPTLCLILLYKKRHVLLEELKVQLKFSFLYKGYHARWYFWEFVILYRKVAVVCASVFLSTVSITVQALSVLAVLLVSLFLQLQVGPFFSSQFNRLELKSILVSAVTIYAGLFYQTESLCECQTATEVNILLFIVIIASNAYFLLSWTRNIIPMIINSLRRRLTHIPEPPAQSPPNQPNKDNIVDFSPSDRQALANLSVSEVRNI